MRVTCSSELTCALSRHGADHPGVRSRRRPGTEFHGDDPYCRVPRNWPRRSTWLCSAPSELWNVSAWLGQIIFLWVTQSGMTIYNNRVTFLSGTVASPTDTQQILIQSNGDQPLSTLTYLQFGAHQRCAIQ